jgi:hypothetical protein
MFHYPASSKPLQQSNAPPLVIASLAIMNAFAAERQRRRNATLTS